MAEELDFDDLGLEAPTSVDEIITDPQPEKKEQKGEPVKDPEPEPEPKKRGRPKKEDTGIKDEPEPDPEPEPEPGDDPVEPEKNENEESFIKGLAERFGLEIPEEMDFQDTEEGLENFVDYASDELADQKLNNWFEKIHPIGRDFFDYLTQLGEDANEENIKEFFGSVKPEIDYKSIDLDDTDVQKAVMRTFFKKMDYSDEEIKDAIDDMEIANTLKKQAQVASKKLEASQEKQRQQLVEKEREANKLRQQKINQFWGEVKQNIESGRVGNFQIPTTEKKVIFEYDTSGKFANDLNEILKDPAKRIELAIAVKNKFNLSKYINTAANTQKVNDLRSKLKQGTSKMKSGNQGGANINSDIDWEI